jgi:gamma-glutamylcyclotransferase (GGCT)/AIG2-like uncharacterized protein YtfP
MLYFAYGSNLDEDQMRDRCPGSRRVARATLRGHELLFAGWSERWGGHVATVQQADGGEVPGLLYELTDSDLVLLDRIEGCPRAYQRELRPVVDEHGQEQLAHVYRLPGPEKGEPTSEYLAVIQRAYRRLGFAEEGLLRAALPGPALRRVFVYGTLLAGESNHRVLRGARLLGPATTGAEFALVSLGNYPGMVRGGETAIAGEVYEVDAPTLAALDQLEGHPDFYRRTPLWPADFGEVEVYVLTPSQVEKCPPIASGSWRIHRKVREP